MSGSQRRGGVIQVQVGGSLIDAKGTFTYGLGTEKREPIVGADGMHGYKAMPQSPFIEGALTDRTGLDMKAFMLTENATVTLLLANGKTVVLRDAFQTGEGSVTTEEGEAAFRFDGSSCEEI